MRKWVVFGLVFDEDKVFGLGLVEMWNEKAGLDVAQAMKKTYCCVVL